MKNFKKLLEPLHMEIDSDNISFSGNFDATEGKYGAALEFLVKTVLKNLNSDISIGNTSGDNRILGNNKICITFKKDNQQYYLEEEEAEVIMEEISELLE